MASGVRPADKGEDAAACARIYAPFVRDTAISFEVDPPDDTEMQFRITNTLPLFPWLVYEDDGEVVGFAYAGRHHPRAAYRWAVEVSVYLDPASQGRGIGTELYARLLELLRAQRYRTAIAGMTVPNDASLALHRSFGFEDIGTYRNIGFKAGKWHDVLWMELELETLGTSPPPEPLPPMG